MHNKTAVDYQTFTEIKDELLEAIDPNGLNLDTLIRLYESKYVYLENLRQKAFVNINKAKNPYFKQSDYQLIIQAIKNTKFQLKKLILVAMHTNLGKRRVG